MPEIDLVRRIAKEMALQEFQVHNTVTLISEEATVPFIARYRKEKTGGLDEVEIRTIRDRYDYILELEGLKKKYLKVIEEQAEAKPEVAAKLPELRAKIAAADTKQILEDIYLPFKPRRRTKAQIAVEKGLEPLLQLILRSRETLVDLLGAAAAFIRVDSTPELSVASAEEALSGASDIYVEQISETAEFRSIARELSFQTAVLVSAKNERLAKSEAAAASPDQPKVNEADEAKLKKSREKARKYENYFDFRESVKTAPSHRIMAIRRGEAEKILKVRIEVDNEAILARLRTAVLKPATDPVTLWLETAILTSYKRHLQPAMENEIRMELKRRAELEAISVFAKNLENLLLLPPIPEQTVLGIDPGLRTGSKLAVVSATGALLAQAVVHPDTRKLESPKTKQAITELVKLITEHRVAYVAIGNGTGSREIDQVVRAAFEQGKIDFCRRLVVNEAGASVYSTDALAREEFPDLDPTIRSAISIARRLQDPLAELVKIDPRSIGVGQYQHDVNITQLNRSLTEVVESCVNRVGVNLNTASYKLLEYVSGIGPTLAQNIVRFRDQNGQFRSRRQILEIQGCGPKAYEQAAGFLRVPDAENPLDNSAVHPERYEIVEQMAAKTGAPLASLIGDESVIDRIPLEQFVTANVGMPTLMDILAELRKPGRDPRADGTRLTYNEDVCDLQDLKKDMKLKGTVTNVTNFGAFVDIGVHQDGLVHISELTQNFVKDPASVVSVGDVLDVRVIDVDVERKRISLSCRPAAPASSGPRPPATNDQRQARPQHAPRPHNQNGPRAPQNNHNQQKHQSKRPDRPQQPKNQPSVPPGPYQARYSLDDLLTKFNSGKTK